MSDIFGNEVNINASPAQAQINAQATADAQLPPSLQSTSSDQNFSMGPGAINEDLLRRQIEQEVTQQYVNNNSRSFGTAKFSAGLDDAIASALSDTAFQARLDAERAAQTQPGNPGPASLLDLPVPSGGYNRNDIVVRQNGALTTPIWGETMPMDEGGSPVGSMDELPIIEGAFGSMSGGVGSQSGNIRLSQKLLIGGMVASNGAGNLERAWHPELAGEAYLPEQAEAQSWTSAIPTALGAAGGTIGFILGGGASAGAAAIPGAIAGTAIGMSLGETAKSAIDTYQGGHEFDPEKIGQALNAGFGGNVQNEGKEFAEALNGAKNAIKEFSEAAGEAARYTKVDSQGYSTLAYHAQETLGAFGGPQAIKAASDFLGSSPLFYEQSQDIAGRNSGGTPLGYQNAALIALTQGDFQSAQRLSGIAQSRGGSGAFGASLPTRYAGIEDERANELMYSSGSAIYGAQLSIAAASGAGAGEISHISGLAAGQERQAAGAYTQRIGQLRDALAATSAPDQQRALTTTINQLEAESASHEASAATVMQSAFQNTVIQSNAVFESTRAGAQASITTQLLGGAKIGDINLDSLFGSYRGQIGALDENAANPLANPELAARLRGEASQLSQQKAEQAYQYKELGYQQNLQSLSVPIAQAESSLGVTLQTGGPSEYAAAFDAVANSLKNSIAELTKQTQDTSQSTADLTIEQRQLADSQRQLAVIGNTAAVTTINAIQSLTGSQASQYMASGQAALMTSGSGYEFQMDVSGGIAALNTRIADERQRLPGVIDPMARAAITSDIAKSELEIKGLYASETNYTPSVVGLGVSAITSAGELQRYSMGFAEPGSQQDALSRMLGVIRSESSEYDNNEARLKAQQGGTLTPEQLENEARTRQGFLTQEAGIEYQSTATYARQLPALTMGGTSFSSRLLPSPAQAAMMLENDGRADAAGRQFGFYSESTGAHLTALAPGMSAAGMIASTAQPGNMTQAALSSVGTDAHSTAILEQILLALKAIPGATGAAIAAVTAANRGKLTSADPVMQVNRQTPALAGNH